MSRLRANQITNENANGAPNFPHGLTVTGIVTATTSATTMSQIVVGSAVTANSNGVDTVGIVTAGTLKDKAGGTFAPNPTTTRGDVIVRGVSADERLAIGTAGQALKVNSGANGLEYGTAGGVIQVKSTTKTDTFSATSTGSYGDITGMSVDITPSQAGSKILVTVMLQLSTSTSYGGHTIILARRVSGSDTYIVGDADGSRTRGTIHAVGGGSNYGYPASRHMSYLDTHGQSTSTAITYKLVHYDPDGNNDFRINGQLGNSNAAGTVRTISSITAMEIASGVL